MVVGPNDAGYRGVLRDAVATASGLTSVGSVDDINPATLPTNPGPPAPYVNRLRGGFVDLCYPVLAGGSLRGPQARRIDRLSTANDAAIRSPNPATEVGDADFLRTPFSGVQYYVDEIGRPPQFNATNMYTPCLYKSGRVVANSGAIVLFQPAFDTYTSSYEKDGFGQGFFGDTGSRWGTTRALTSASVDRGSDGIDNNGILGIDENAEKETCPPFTARPEAIRVTVRIENPTTRQLRQGSVVIYDER